MVTKNRTRRQTGRARYRGAGLILCVVLLLIADAWSAETRWNVQVREGQVRSAPSFLAEIVARPSYGERVTLIQDQGAWKKVKTNAGVQGWMHVSALTTKNLALRAGTTNQRTSATGGEIALAGKGFSEDVEKQFKNLNRNLDYTWVDRMESFRVSPEEMQTFLKQGELAPAEGGAK